MNILMMKVTIRVVWPQSLKEKRMILQSIVQRLKNKFNVSVAEVENQNNHKLITIGILMVASDKKIIDASIDKILDFIENNVDGELIRIEHETDLY